MFCELRLVVINESTQILSQTLRLCSSVGYSEILHPHICKFYMFIISPGSAVARCVIGLYISEDDFPPTFLMYE